MASKVKTLPDDENDPHKICSFIHNMHIGESVLIDGKIELTLQKSQDNKSTVRIKAPKSVPIARNTKKY